MPSRLSSRTSRHSKLSHMQQIPCRAAGDRFLPDLVYITFGLHKKRKKRIDNLFDLWYKVKKVIRFLQEADRMESMQDKFMTTVRIGPKGQIVIPKEVRAMFGLEPGIRSSCWRTVSAVSRCRAAATMILSCARYSIRVRKRRRPACPRRRRRCLPPRWSRS